MISQNKNHIFLKKIQQSKEQFERDVIHGLSANPKKYFPFKYNYDEAGSKILQDAQQQKAYYLWSSDKDILENQAIDFLKLIDSKEFNLIDLGAGDGSKTRIFIGQAIKYGYDVTYIPVDISEHANIDLIKVCSQEYPTLKMQALTGEYEDGLNWIKDNTKNKNVFLFPGSTFGNQSVEKNIEFLSQIYASMKKNDQFFLGVDMWKNPYTLARAYMDNQWAGAFIMNILNRINKQLNGNFILQNYYPYFYFDPFERCVRGMIVSKIDQEVEIGQKKFMIKETEPIGISISKKWLKQQVEEMCQKSGFMVKAEFNDKLNYFRYLAFQKPV